MIDFSLQNKTFLVTGASSGIGAQTACSIAEMGGKLVLSARNEERLKQVKSKLKGRGHQILRADLTHKEEIENLVEEMPPLDGLVQSCGIVRPFPVKFIRERQIEEMFSINYKAPVLLTSRLLRTKKIKSPASLVFMSSVSSHFSHKGGGLYAGSKAALNAYSKTIAIEFGEKRIRSNVITAAMVKTPIFEEAEKAVSKEMMEKHGADYPLGFGEPQDVANAIIFLLSAASKWITGTELVMDGGLTAGK